MSNNFDWRTDEDGEWDGARPESKRKIGGRRWFLPLAIVVLVIVAAGVVYWQVQERIAAAEAAIRDDVESSFHLIHEANEAGDIELFRNLLSGSDLEWAVAQQDLFAEGWLFDLSPFGLGQEPETVADIEVTLAPQLSSAELTAAATYLPAGGSDSSSPVVLLQTIVFRKGERWVWSPPKNEFWAGNASIEERYLAVSYPKRDEDLAMQLAGDLDSIIAEVCTGVPQLECPTGLNIGLEFSRDPGVLVEIAERFAREGLFGARLTGRSRATGLTMTLPTPSLLGLPVDDAGYEALLKGYGTYLVTALTERFVDEECCGTEARLRAATRKMLLDLDLNAWPAFDVAAQTNPGEATIEDQVALLCSDGFGREQRLLILDLAGMAWRQEAMEPQLRAIKSMPAGDGILVLGQMETGDEIRSQVWRHSLQGRQLLFDLPVDVAEADRLSWEIHEQQALLVIEVPDVVQGYSRFFTIDLKECEQNDCASAPTSTVSRPVWSPDGSQLLVRAYGLLWWREGVSMVPIAEGSAPFWVDDDTYGYARSVGQEQAVVLVQSGQQQAEQVVLTTNDLRQALDQVSRRNDLVIGRVIVGQPSGANESGVGRWLILVLEIGRGGAVSRAHFLAFDPESRAINILPQSGRLLSFNVAPSGDIMALGGFEEAQGAWKITVVDRDLAEVATLAMEPGGSADAVPSYSWSRDEGWLLTLEQGVLTLFEPATGTIHKIKPPEASCVQAAWYGVNREP